MRFDATPPGFDTPRGKGIILYPSFAYQSEATPTWHAAVSGFAYRDDVYGMRQRMFLHLLKQAIRVDQAILDSSEHYQTRIRGFLADPLKGQTVTGLIGEEHRFEARKSKRNGHFRGIANLTDENVKAWQSETNQTTSAESRVVETGAEFQTSGSHVHFVPAEGVSVISDIDDTIKVSQVAHRGQLLHNTFLNPFAAVPGMAELYQRWEKEGAVFHYVSSSPWQLFTPLQQLLDSSGFPRGSFHLRTIRFSDPSVVWLFLSSKRTKYLVICATLRAFPNRKFVLVGDSGEKDPEIYGKVARRFPGQVQRIFIRRVKGNPWTRKRVEKAFRRLPRSLWRAFKRPEQLSNESI